MENQKSSSPNTENARMVQTMIPNSAEGVRADVFLAERFTYCSRNAWQKLIQSGNIKLNQRTIRTSRRLHAGEILSFETRGLKEPEVNRNYRILSDTPDYCAIEKSAGIPVHPSGCYFHNTLLSILNSDLHTTLFPVNRLDRETSGIVLFAKNTLAAKKLDSLFRLGKIEKEYLAAVHGEFLDMPVMADGFLIQDRNSPVRKKRHFLNKSDCETIPDEAESCCTEICRITYKNGLSLVKCIPHTGRLHQIRATLHSLGYPLVGDKLYGLNDRLYLSFIEGKLTEEDKKLLILERQALHAEKLEFVSPFTGEKTMLHSELPREISNLFHES